MQLADLVRDGERVMTVCNSCRYCEQYCPVFPAVEQRRTFSKADLVYLSNLCHHCGECLYACQYAPPHEFGIDVPRTLGQLRFASYQEYCWPGPLGAAFRQQGLATALALVTAFSVVMYASVEVTSAGALWRSAGEADFYAVVPYRTMVALFGGVFAFVVAAIAIGAARFWRDVRTSRPAAATQDALRAQDAALSRGAGASPFGDAGKRAIRDMLTLRHLHAGGMDCVTSEEERTPWRRWFHHSTFYGFLLCFASTVVAAIYHNVLGLRAPYGYASLPVILGTVGGIGLLVGPVGLLWQRRHRDPALVEDDQRGFDTSFIALLFLTSLTGLLLLALRETSAMGLLLIVHLGAVLALFVTLPYGKFVHGVYRTAALMKYHAEKDLLRS